MCEFCYLFIILLWSIIKIQNIFNINIIVCFFLLMLIFFSFFNLSSKAEAFEKRKHFIIIFLLVMIWACFSLTYTIVLVFGILFLFSVYMQVYIILNFFYIICIVYYSFIVFLFLFFHLFPSSMFLAFKSPVNMYHFGVFLYCSSLQSLVVRFVPSVCMGAGIFILIFVDLSANLMFFW